MRDLVQRSIDADGVVGRAPPRRGQRGVTVNLAESPLAWLAARGLLSEAQLEAGERLRADYEAAQLGARVTMRWDAAPAGTRGRGAAPVEPGLGALAAKRRFDAAIAAVGPGLRDILWRVVCAGESVPGAEKALGWPARAGRLVLGMALDRLAAHYGLG